MLAVGWTCEIRVSIRVMGHGRLGNINWADRLAILTLDACHVQTSRAVPWARTSLDRQRVILGRVAGGPSGGRTRCALLTRYAFGDDTIGSGGFIAAVTRTAWPLPFGGAGL